MLIVFIESSRWESRSQVKRRPSCGFLCCLATSKAENPIISAKFDKCPYSGRMSSRFPKLNFRLYAILVFIKVFWFRTKIFYTIHLLGLSDRDYFWNRGISWVKNSTQILGGAWCKIWISCMGVSLIIHHKLTKENMLMSNDIAIYIIFSACILQICSKRYFLKRGHLTFSCC